MKKFEIRESPIHGKGVFATAPIIRGEFIGQYLARRTDLDTPYTLWIEWDDGPRGYEGFGRLRFANHAPRPNAEFVERDLFARSRIHHGDKITIHYGDEWVETK